MSSSSATASTGGISIFALFGVLFVALKLTHHIDWPWIWVTAPLWVPVALVLALIAISLVLLLVVWVFNALTGRSK